MKKLFYIVIMLLSFQAIAAEPQDAAPIESITSGPGTCGRYDRLRIAIIEKRLEASKEALINLGCTPPESKAVLKQLERDGVLVFRCGEWQATITEKAVK